MSDVVDLEGQGEPVVDHPDPIGFDLPPENAISASEQKLREEWAAREAELKKQADTGSVLNQMAQLLAQQGKPAVPLAPQPQAPAFDYEKFREENDSKFFEGSPTEKVGKTAATFLGPAFAKQQAEIFEVGRMAMRVDPNYRTVFELYNDEIEATAKSLPGGMSFSNLRQAADLTKTRHIDEFIKRGVDEARAAAATQPAPSVVPSTPSRSSVPGGFAGGSAAPPAPSPAKLSAEQVLERAGKSWGVPVSSLKALAERRGYPIDMMAEDIVVHLKAGTKPSYVR